MALYNPLEWRNENALSGYPLTQETDYQSFLVDAKFVQFDNFIPVLNTAFVDNAKIRLTITFDYGIHTAIELIKSNYNLGEAYRSVRIYQPDTARYLGMLVFGDAPSNMWATISGSSIKFNTPFAPETVRSIPKKDAVYTFDGSYGDVQLARTEDDAAVFYNTSNTGGFNSITFNAVGGHSKGSNIAQGLRKINLVGPIVNNINLVSNDVIKIVPSNAVALTVSLVAGTSATSFTIPSLNS